MLRYNLFFVVFLWAFSLQAKMPLTAGLPSFPPFAFDESEEFKVGSLIQYYRLLSAKTGIPIKVVRMPYARIKRSLESGSLDMAIIFRNDDLKQFVDYVGLVSYSQVAILPRHGKLLERYEHLSSLNGIAVIRGASFGEPFDSDKNLNKYLVNDYLQGMWMLKLGRVDAVVGSLSGLEYTSTTAGFDSEILGEAFLLKDKQWWLHFSKQSKHKELQPKIAQAIIDFYQPYLIYNLYKSSNDYLNKKEKIPPKISMRNR